MPVQLTCFTCDQPVLRKPSHVLLRTFCSIACARLGSRGKVATPPLPTEYMDDGLTAKIPLVTCTDVVLAYAMIDLSDVELVEKYRWTLDHGYVTRQRPRQEAPRHQRMHRLILGLVPGDKIEVDHRNRDRCDNRRQNLRLVTRAEQMQNVPSHAGSTSSYRGVCWDKVNKKWMAYSHANGRVIRLGRFCSEIEAAEVAHAARARLMPFAVD